MIPKNMRGVVYLEPGRIELRELPTPQPGPNDLLVRIRAGLTCGTDVKTYRRGHPIIKPPTLFGHEYAGDIVEVGANVSGFEPGTRVVAHNSAPCGTCFWCKHGQTNMCDQPVYNFGAFAEYIVVPGPIVRLNTYEIPDHLSYAQAAIMEPLSTVVHGQGVVDIQPGETVAIIGVGGPIGLMHLQMALHRGASQVIGVDLKEPRLAVARQLGATTVINPQLVDPLEAIFDLTKGRGVDVAIESAGTAATWLTALRSARKGGRVLWFGGLPQGTEISLDTHIVHYNELSLFGTYHCTTQDVYRAFQLITAGVVDARPLISGEMPLERVEDALQEMIAGTCVKMAILPDMGYEGEHNLELAKMEL
jgi:L-iditol 2-dehydrogenase